MCVLLSSFTPCIYYAQIVAERKTKTESADVMQTAFHGKNICYVFINHFVCDATHMAYQTSTVCDAS
jgi:hypothetical protein